jgi:hypothetical protein
MTTQTRPSYEELDQDVARIETAVKMPMQKPGMPSYDELDADVKAIGGNPAIQAPKPIPDLSKPIEVKKPRFNERGYDTTKPIGFVEGMDRPAAELLPFVRDIAAGKKEASVLLAKQRLEANAYADEWERLKDSDIVNQYEGEKAEIARRGMTTGGMIGRGISELPAYGLEFASTGGVASTGGGLARKGAVKVLGEAATSKAGKVVTTTADILGGAAARTAVNQPRLAAGAMEGVNEGNGAVSSYFKTAAKEWIENASEASGESLGQARKVLASKIFTPKTVEAMSRMFKTLHPDKATDKLFTSAGINDFVDEIGEEALARLLTVGTGLEPGSIVPTMQEALATVGTLAVPTGARGAIGMAAKLTEPSEAEKAAAKEFFTMTPTPKAAPETIARPDQQNVVQETKDPDPATHVMKVVRDALDKAIAEKAVPEKPTYEQLDAEAAEISKGTPSLPADQAKEVIPEPAKLEQPVPAAKKESSPFETPEWKAKVNTALEHIQKWAGENEEVAEKVAEPESATATIQENRIIEPESKPMGDEEKERLLNEVEAGWSQEKPADKVQDPTNLIVEASRAGVALTKSDVAGVMKQDPATIEKIQSQTQERKSGATEQAKQNKALEMARKRVWQIEKSRNYDVAKKELGKRISKKKRQQIESILAADTEYQDALKTLSTEERKDSAKVFKADRTRKILQAEAGKVDKSDLAAAPLHTLPPVVKSKIQEHARYLQAQQKPGSPTHKALERVIKDAGSDNTAEAIKQKERIIGQISGKRGVENISGKWRREEADPILSLYTAENGSQMAEQAIASIDQGEPDFIARQLIQEIEGRIEAGTDKGMPMEAVNVDNPDADAAPSDIARRWLEQVAGTSVPKVSAQATVAQERVSAPSTVAQEITSLKHPKDLLGRPILDPIGREQKDLGFAKSQSGETPIETESGKAWVTPEGKIRPETDKKAEAEIEKELSGKGQMTIEESSATNWEKRVDESKKRVKEFFTSPRLNTGIPLDVLGHLTILGADIIRKMAKNGKVHVGQWGSEMVRLIGTKRLVGLNLNKVYQASTVYHGDMVRSHKLRLMKDKYPELVDGNGSLFNVDEITPEHIFTKAEDAAGKDIGRQSREILKMIKAEDREEQKAARQEEKAQERIEKAKKQLEYDLSLRAKQERSAQILGELTDELNPISGFTAYGQDPYRVFKKVFGKHYGKARKLILAPFDQAKGAFVSDQEKWLDEVWKVIVKQYGIKAGSKESADLQRYGEGKLMTNTVKGLGFMPGTHEWADLTEYGEGKVARNYLENTYGKTKAAQMIQAVKTIKDNYGEGKAGLRKMFGLALEEKYGRARAENIRAADRWFRQSYNQLLNEVNAARKQQYPNNPDKIISAREDYYRHFQELSVGVSGLMNIFDTPANISSSMALQSEYTKPRSKWLPFAQKRTGDKTTYDAVGGFLDYLKYAAYAKHIDPHTGAFRSLAQELVVKTEGTKNEGKLNSFITYLDDLSGELAGKTNFLDRPGQKIADFMHMDGRKVFRFLNLLNNQLKINLILGNVGSALSQPANIAVGAARVGPVNVVRGFGRSVAGWIIGNDPMEHSSFLKERYFDGYSRFDRGILKYPKAFAKWMLTVLDEAGTKYLWNCFYEQGKRKGVSDPVAYADGMTRSVVAGRGVGEVPLAQKSKVVQLLMPFQLEVANFWYVVKDMIDERAFGQLIMLAVYDWLFNLAMEKIKGSPVLYDPIQATMDAAKEFMQEENKVRGAFKFAGREAGEFLENVPGGNIIAAVMEGNGSPYKESIFGKNTPSRFGVGLIPETFKSARSLKEWAEDPSWDGAEKVGLDSLNIIPPFGGNQIKKTYEGISTYMEGEDRDKKGRLKWRVDQTPGNLLNSILFGKYGTTGAKDYLEKKNGR